MATAKAAKGDESDDGDGPSGGGGGGAGGVTTRAQIIPGGIFQAGQRALDGDFAHVVLRVVGEDMELEGAQLHAGVEIRDIGQEPFGADIVQVGGQITGFLGGEHEGEKILIGEAEVFLLVAKV